MEKTPNNISLEEIIYKLRKKLIEDVRKLDDDSKISIKEIFNDDEMIKLVLFDGENFDKPSNVSKYVFMYANVPYNDEGLGTLMNKIMKRHGITRDTLLTTHDLSIIPQAKFLRMCREYDRKDDARKYTDMYREDFYGFFYSFLPTVCDCPWKVYFSMKLPFEEYGKLRLALPNDVLKKIDFTGVLLDKVYSMDSFDFSILSGISIDPQDLHYLDFRYSVLKGVTFIKPFDEYSLISGVDFTGSKNAMIDPITIKDMMNCNFRDVTFTDVINNDNNIRGAKFGGSTGAIIDLDNVIYDEKTDFTDADVRAKKFKTKKFVRKLTRKPDNNQNN